MLPHRNASFYHHDADSCARCKLDAILAELPAAPAAQSASADEIVLQVRKEIELWRVNDCILAPCFELIENVLSIIRVELAAAPKKEV